MNAWLEQRRTLVLSIVGLAVVGTALALAFRWQRPAVIEVAPPPPTATPGPVRVYVSGAVRQPDVYTLPPGAIVRDAIDAAGGPTGEANLDAVNLAASLHDEQQILVPVIGEAPAVAEDEQGPAVTFPLNLNTATASELEALPGIGPALAQAIIDYREAYGPFTDTAQVQYVPGIGPAKFAEIQELITAQ